MSLPTWVHWTLRAVAWAVWQLIVLSIALVLFASFFSEYGVYGGHPVIDSTAAIVFLLLALYFGSWLPLRQWRAARQNADMQRPDW
jgi:hypothetical protein